MKRKTLVKLMAILLVGLLIVLGIIIGMKKGESDDSRSDDIKTEQNGNQEEEGLVPEDEFEDVFEYDEDSEPIKSDRTDDTEDVSNEDSDKDDSDKDDSDKDDSDKDDSDEKDTDKNEDSGYTKPETDESAYEDFKGIVLPDDEFE